MIKNTSQQKIIEAVITCIETYGLEKTTTRKIAKEAGTNIASINYYFRSKDDLIAQALGATLQHMTEDLLVIIRNEEESFDAILNEWIIYLLEGAKRYPRVFMAHMYAPLVEKRFDAPGPQAFRNMFDVLAERALRAHPDKDQAELRFVLVEVISAMIFMSLAPGFFTETENLSTNELAEWYGRVFTRAISVG